uniref:Mfs general substrate transporter n=1 Tax=Tetraselmis sp. GSL018 TaxID=582737 RepID=A0A061R4Z2_9CHLO|mmetsp:Transcript_24365/g.58073  ORF Transcript_24365/g.58073 Transcript_24365/m.58073 type:complete len:464 (+) Transcript_24365:169-1560(+)|eukprot:CAMPEP_0177602892 /NCGR_PEP_ID=MMETSP0419_2-20121207/15171_1 /TAXON_ID=582737 /ORGANISM="Tetraselmis sp., Strain GSL018" /LENGTH=463 /DNA_ID=CAMNT_0019096527 /DNA_START=119 /DNA_END=1510 /DNA_ORIENTATION=+
MDGDRDNLSNSDLEQRPLREDAECSAHLPPQNQSSTDVGAPHVIGACVAAFCMLCSGTLYAFGAYSDNLKAALGWTQLQMEIVGYMGDCGVYVSGPITGSIQDLYGPRVACGVAAVLFIVGYGGIALALTTGAFRSHIVFGILLYLAGAGSGLMYVSSLSSNILLFPERYRGKLVGALVSLFGLSALFYTTIYHALLGGQDPARLLTLLAVACGSAAVLGFAGLPRVLRAVGRMRWDSAPSESRSLTQSVKSIGDRFGVLFASGSYWMLLAIFTMVAGNGLMIINNLGSIAGSVAPASGPSLKATLVSMTSACNCVGRLASGVISDLLPWRRGTFFMIGAGIFASAIGIALATETPGVLYLMVVGVGVAYGILWAIMPTCVSEIFGAESFGQNWGCMLMAPAAGALIFNTLAGAVYDARGSGEGVCLGWRCFRPSLAVAMCCCGIAIAVAVAVTPRTRRGNGS